MTNRDFYDHHDDLLRPTDETLPDQEIPAGENTAMSATSDESPLRAETMSEDLLFDEGDEVFPFSETGELLVSAEIADIMALVEEDAMQWQQDELCLPSLYQEFQWFMVKERAKKHPSSLHEDSLSAENVPVAPLPRHVRSRRKGFIFWQIVFASIATLTLSISYLSLLLNKSYIPPFLENFLSPITLTIFLIMGAIAISVGFILLDIEVFESAQNNAKLERRSSQLGIFVIGICIASVVWTLFQDNFNNLAGSLLMMLVGGLCSAISVFIVNRMHVRMRIAVRVISVLCLICGIIFLALPISSLITHSFLTEANVK